MLTVLFCGMDYYPRGGNGDIVAVMDVGEDEAIARAEAFMGGRQDDWKQLVALDPYSGWPPRGDEVRVVAGWHRVTAIRWERL